MWSNGDTVNNCTCVLKTGTSLWKLPHYLSKCTGDTSVNKMHRKYWNAFCCLFIVFFGSYQRTEMERIEIFYNFSVWKCNWNFSSISVTREAGIHEVKIFTCLCDEENRSHNKFILFNTVSYSRSHCTMGYLLRFPSTHYVVKRRLTCLMLNPSDVL